MQTHLAQFPDSRAVSPRSRRAGMTARQLQGRDRLFLRGSQGVLGLAAVAAVSAEDHQRMALFAAMALVIQFIISSVGG